MKTEKEPLEPQCSVCGYYLGGLPSDWRCPECGTPMGLKTEPPLSPFFRIMRALAVTTLLWSIIIGGIGYYLRTGYYRFYVRSLGSDMCMDAAWVGLLSWASSSFMLLISRRARRSIMIWVCAIFGIILAAWFNDIATRARE